MLLKSNMQGHFHNIQTFSSQKAYKSCLVYRIVPTVRFFFFLVVDQTRGHRSVFVLHIYRCLLGLSGLEFPLFGHCKLRELLNLKFDRMDLLYLHLSAIIPANIVVWISKPKICKSVIYSRGKN